MNVYVTEVNGGWSLYPVAYLPAASTMEAQLTSAQFDSSLFSLATGENFKGVGEEGYEMPVFESLPVQTGGTITLTKPCTEGSVVINGLEESETSTVEAGYYYVNTSGTTTTIKVKVGTGGDFVVGDFVDVNYTTNITDAVEMGVSNDKAAIGSADFIWPLYNGGENTTASQFTGASIMGWVIMHIYRVRVTAMPGFDTSYKTAATNGITVATMDPKYAVGANGNAYKMIYVKNTNNA